MTDSRFDKEPHDWMKNANCAGVDVRLFFPQKGEDARPAKAVCAGCVVRRECNDYAEANNEKWGVWGGVTVYERRYAKTRALRAAAGRSMLVDCLECGEPFEPPTRATTLCGPGCRHHRNSRLRRERYADKETS